MSDRESFSVLARGDRNAATLTDDELALVTRVVLVDETGRIYDRGDLDARISLQDDGRTLKVFVERRRT